jgi:hypothetical protein
MEYTGVRRFRIKSTVAGEIGNGNDPYTITLFNIGSAPAAQTRIRTISSVTNEDVLPPSTATTTFR